MSYWLVEDMMGVVVKRVRLEGGVAVGLYLLRSEENEKLRGAVWCISIEESSEGTVGTCTYMFAVWAP